MTPLYRQYIRALFPLKTLIQGEFARLACLMFALQLAVPVYGATWETVFDEGGVTVQRRPYRDSPLMEMKGEVRVASSLNALMALLKDADFNRHWVYRSGGARILSESGYRQAYVYGVVDAPWPLQDRDTVVRFDYSQELATREIIITITNFPEYIPAEPGLVRVPDFGGFWRLRPLPTGEVDVTYQVRGDPGGWVPVWIANYAAAVSVTRTLQNLPHVVGRYQGASSDLVRELEVH